MTTWLSANRLLTRSNKSFLPWFNFNHGYVPSLFMGDSLAPFHWTKNRTRLITKPTLISTKLTIFVINSVFKTWLIIYSRGRDCKTSQGGCNQRTSGNERFFSDGWIGRMGRRSSAASKSHKFTAAMISWHGQVRREKEIKEKERRRGDD